MFPRDPNLSKAWLLRWLLDTVAKHFFMQCCDIWCLYHSRQEAAKPIKYCIYMAKILTNEWNMHPLEWTHWKIERPRSIFMNCLKKFGSDSLLGKGQKVLLLSKKPQFVRWIIEKTALVIWCPRGNRSKRLIKTYFCTIDRINCA